MRARNVLHAAALAIVATTVATTVGAGNTQQRPEPTLHLAVIVAEYYQVEYLPPPTPPALFVVFAGEPLEVQVGVGNRGSIDEDLATSQVPLEEAMSVSALKLPPGAAVPRVVLRAQGRLETVGGGDITWGGDLRVPSRGQVTFRGSLDIPANAPAGVYEIQFTPHFSGVTSRVNPLATIMRFEVRAGNTFEERVDMARRRMYRLCKSDDCAAADAAADALLEMYPTSSSAYEVKGRAAEARGELQRAVSAYERARTLLTQGDDRLWLAYAPGYKVRETIEHLTERIQSGAKKVPIVIKH